MTATHTFWSCRKPSGGEPVKVIPAPLHCPCSGEHFSEVFRYDSPPEGETRFDLDGEYKRDVVCCGLCGHFVTIHDMDVDALYTSQYVSSTYGDDGLQGAYERIIGLDPARSDNVARVNRVVEFARTAGLNGTRTLLDVGSGLCVFPRAMKAAGWDCTAVDPDVRAVAHAREVVGVNAVCGDFMEIDDLGRFDAVTFNKVLEHVKDPVAMLAKAARHLNDGGVVYVELPDGEGAAVDGPGREEFFLEHWHVFSAASLEAMASRSGFELLELERLREPSDKYTLRGFMAKAQNNPSR